MRRQYSATEGFSPIVFIFGEGSCPEKATGYSF